MAKLALELPAVANKPVVVDAAAHMVAHILQVVLQAAGSMAAVVALNTEAYHLWNYHGLTAVALMDKLALALPAVANNPVALVVAAAPVDPILPVDPLHSMQVHYHMQNWKLL